MLSSIGSAYLETRFPHMANSTQPNRDDPIRRNYFRPLEVAESISGWLFYLGAAISFAPLVINQINHPKLYSGALVAFSTIVVMIFIAGNATRLYFFPRAEDARRKEFISNTFGFDLIHHRTTGYYNNDETDPQRRMGLSVLENLFFTKTILRKMAPFARAKVLIYALAWLVVVLYRETPSDWIATAAQVIFSEILSRWLRLEWARARAERIYDASHRLFQSSPDPNRLFPYALEAFGEYETGKALGGILLSQSVFQKNNQVLSAEWELVKRGLPVLSNPTNQ